MLKRTLLQALQVAEMVVKRWRSNTNRVQDLPSGNLMDAPFPHKPGGFADKA
jgi:hypothetical protein